ncbi:C40 family peptidase [Alkalihalobacillus deserti]|uniref:C40 family peptidase n=1 Tax=Alkalihalobacillus deserti TaxID=2879466 RepID=UPI001D146066|nr:peptidoglycan-binding protein [Alkalihalobacillus deserti]
MNVKTTSTFILSTAMFSTVLTMPLTDHKEEASIKPVSREMKLQTNQVLQFGSAGPKVYEVQSYLKTFDYYTGQHDGIYGVLTKQAVHTYQEKHYLKKDGIAGPATIGHLLYSSNIQVNLNGMTSEKMKEEPNNPNEVVTEKASSIKIFVQGDQGSKLTEFQRQLQKHGYYSGVDGIFGPKTTAAVRLFQEKHGLQVDGLIGPETKVMLAKTDEIQPTSVQVHQPTKVTEQKRQTTQPVSETKSTLSNLTQTASSLKGTPYVWGGTSPVGFDCSGFIRYVFNKHGKNLPRTTTNLYQKGQAVSNLQPGDIVFFTTYKSGPSHAGIYLGNREFIHAGSSTGVATASLNQSYWSERYLGAKRF